MLHRNRIKENAMAHERIEKLVLRKLGAGMSPEAILVDHPRLTLDDIRAAQAFAADYLADEDIVYG
jgi:uncharacterized protein (DUF433 family)